MELGGVGRVFELEMKGIVRNIWQYRFEAGLTIQESQFNGFCSDSIRFRFQLQDELDILYLQRLIS